MSATSGHTRDRRQTFLETTYLYITGGDNPSQRTVLQQHCDFWDEDKDGIIYPMDTYRFANAASKSALSITHGTHLGHPVCRGFRKIGAPVWMSFLAIFFIHGSFSYWTLPGWIPDPTFPIYTARIHKVVFMAPSCSMSMQRASVTSTNNTEDMCRSCC